MFDKNTFGNEKCSEVLATVLNELGDRHKSRKISVMLVDFNTNVKYLLQIDDRARFEYLLGLVRSDFIIKCDKLYNDYPKIAVSLTKNVISTKYNKALAIGKSK